MDAAAVSGLRDRAIEELQFKPPAAPDRRHEQAPAGGASSGFDFIEVLRLPRSEIGDWSRVRAWTDLRVRKACYGSWSSLNQAEMELLRLARALPGVATYLGNELVTGPDGQQTELFTMAYRGLDLEKWQAVCLAEGAAHVDPFKKAEFWLALTLSILERALLPFHSDGFVHCDLKPDNLCAPAVDVAIDGGDLTGAIDLANIALIDFGAALGPPGSGRGGQSRLRARFSVLQGESDPRSVYRYVSEAYLRGVVSDRVDAIDGRVDLYSLAYWLRRMVFAHDTAAMGDGPWPAARLRDEIAGEARQRDFLLRLPGLIWRAADAFRNEPELLPHAELGAQIRRVMPVVKDRWFFRAPLSLPHAAWTRNPARARSALLSVVHAERPDLRRVATDPAAPPPSAPPRSAPTEVYRGPVPSPVPPPLPSGPGVSAARSGSPGKGLWLVAALVAVVIGGWLIKVAADARQAQQAAAQRADALEAQRQSEEAAKAAEAARLDKLRGFVEAINDLRTRFSPGPSRRQACEQALKEGNGFAAICLAREAVLHLPQSRSADAYAAALQEYGFDEGDRADLETIAGKTSPGEGHAGAQSLLAMDATLRTDHDSASRWATAAAEQGDLLAMSMLGWLYWNGSGVARDESKAAEWYRRAAEAGHPPAWSDLAGLYESGRGVEKDEEVARDLYRKAADSDWTPAVIRLGSMLLDGRGGDPDPVQGVRLLRKAADLGDPEGMYQFSMLFRDGRGVDANPEESVRWARLAAEAGYGLAIHEMGRIHEQGRGDVAASPTEALTWYRKAVDLEIAVAMTELGRMHLDGVGVSRNYASALDWFRKAVAAGDAGAARFLGYMYDLGLGVEEDNIEAARFYRQVADSGDAASMFNLGLMFQQGDGIQQNNEEAARLYRRAAAKGHLGAMNNLAIMHERGEGVTHDMEESLRLTRKSAEGGNLNAMFNLGLKYEHGEAVAIDMDEAIRWWTRAARQGETSSQKKLRALGVEW
jgi:TPR repeat protein